MTLPYPVVQISPNRLFFFPEKCVRMLKQIGLSTLRFLKKCCNEERYCHIFISIYFFVQYPGGNSFLFVCINQRRIPRTLRSRGSGTATCTSCRWASTSTRRTTASTWCARGPTTTGRCRSSTARRATRASTSVRCRPSPTAANSSTSTSSVRLHSSSRGRYRHSSAYTRHHGREIPKISR